jgi:phosphoribosylformimino-5-aminoimidazole carboxamide ribotide isomerase
MRVIGVLDLANGGAVHAVAGRRREYRAVRSCLVPRPGDAVALARAYRDVLRLREVYVADLDAIAGGAPQRALVREVVRAAAPAGVLVDAGVSTAEQALRTLADGAERVVVGLETLPDLSELEPLVREVTSILVLDLAHVGTGCGVDIALVRRIRRACPAVALLAGGGVRDRAELARLADAGVDGALVATSLHDGRLTAQDIEALGAEPGKA